MIPYRGRFAPSPTGPLHFGSLVAAVASFADARAHQGEWLVRIEDVDTPRTVPGAADEILRQLEAYGFAWNGPVWLQSHRDAHYSDALARLAREGWAYPCGCSRRDIGEDGVYPGTCRTGLNGRNERAWRLRVEGIIGFQDRLRGPLTEDLERQCGDFVLRRADGLWAYQLAVVVDDAAQGVTHVVRGADLLDSTARQIYLQRRLGLDSPAYLHTPLAFASDGTKLSKQTGARALPLDGAHEFLALAAAFLGHTLPKEMAGCPVPEFWNWLVIHWDATRIPVHSPIPIS